MNSPVFVWLGRCTAQDISLGVGQLKITTTKSQTLHDIPEAIYLGNIFQLLLGRRESIVEEGENSNEKVIAPQGVCGGGKGRFEALWGLFRLAVPMSRTPTGCTYLQAKS